MVDEQPTGREVAEFVAPMVEIEADDMLAVAIVAVAEDGRISVVSSETNDGVVALMQTAIVYMTIPDHGEAANGNPLAMVQPDVDGLLRELGVA